MRLLLLPLVMMITPVALSEDYVSKAEPIDYKCVPDTETGVNWDSDGDDHRLVTFKSNEYKDFFLIHTSNVPKQASRFKNDVENLNLTPNESYIYEFRSYYYRTQDLDPNDPVTYLRSPDCKYWSGRFDESFDDDTYISCSSLGRSFSLDLDSMRFVRSYLGTWHEQSKDSKYAGDSAVISYGTCSKYFR